MSMFREVMDKNPDAIKAANSYLEFIDAASISDGMKEHLRKYAGEYNERWFLTEKLHGYSIQPVLFPEVTSFSALFDEAQLMDLAIGNGKYREEGVRLRGVGFCFVNGRNTERTDKAGVPFGQMGHKLYISVTPFGEFFCFGSTAGKTFGTYAKPNKKLWRALGCDDLLDASMTHSFEIVRRSNGQNLVIARRDFGTQWIAILPDIDLCGMLPADHLAQWLGTKAYEASVRSCVDGKTVDLDKAASLGIEIRVRP